MNNALTEGAFTENTYTHSALRFTMEDERNTEGVGDSPGDKGARVQDTTLWVVQVDACTASVLSGAATQDLGEQVAKAGAHGCQQRVIAVCGDQAILGLESGRHRGSNSLETH